jgi:hypothetical protein
MARGRDDRKEGRNEKDELPAVDGVMKIVVEGSREEKAEGRTATNPAPRLWELCPPVAWLLRAPSPESAPVKFSVEVHNLLSLIVYIVLWFWIVPYFRARKHTCTCTVARLELRKPEGLKLWRTFTLSL